MLCVLCQPAGLVVWGAEGCIRAFVLLCGSSLLYMCQLPAIPLLLSLGMSTQPACTRRVGLVWVMVGVVQLRPLVRAPGSPMCQFRLLLLAMLVGCLCQGQQAGRFPAPHCEHEWHCEHVLSHSYAPAACLPVLPARPALVRPLLPGICSRVWS